MVRHPTEERPTDPVEHPVDRQGEDWLVYVMQKKSTIKQDEHLKRLKELDERHDTILKLIQDFQKHQEKLLQQILSLDKKIDSVIEKKKNTI